MRVNRSIVLAVVIAAAGTGWVLSGQFDDGPATAAAQTAADQAPPAARDPRTRVRVIRSTADDYVAVVRAAGQTHSARSVEIRVETEGRVVRVGPAKGSLVEAGDVILELDEADRPAQLERASARVEQRRIEHDAARQLAARGYQAETKRAEALADLQEARAEQARIRVDLDRTRVVAPFRAVLDRRPVEIGDYLQVGDAVATLVELDPMRAVAQIPESEAPALGEGMPASVRLSNGFELPAILTYTAAVADPATRTFTVEATFQNPDGRIGQGMTAELRVPLPPRRAHHISPAAFILDDDGRIGVVVVDDTEVARFHPVAVLGSDGAGAWVAGLPESTRIIMVGQQLVKDGEAVTAVEVDPRAPQS